MKHLGKERVGRAERAHQDDGDDDGCRGKTTGSHACEEGRGGTSDVRDDEEYDETERPGCEDWRNAGEQGDWRKPGYECHDEGDDGKEGQGIFQRRGEQGAGYYGSGTDVEKRE